MGRLRHGLSRAPSQFVPLRKANLVQRAHSDLFYLINLAICTSVTAHSISLGNGLPEIEALGRAGDSSAIAIMIPKKVRSGQMLQR